MKKILLFLTVISSFAAIDLKQFLIDLKAEKHITGKNFKVTEQWVKDGILEYPKSDMLQIASVLRDNDMKEFFKRFWDNIKFTFGFESVKGKILDKIYLFRGSSYAYLDSFKTRLSKFDNSYDYKSQKDSIKEFFGDVSEYGNFLPPDKEFKDKCLDLLARSGYRPNDYSESDKLGKFLFGHDDDYNVSEFKEKVKKWATKNDVKPIKDTGTTKYGDNSGKLPGERGYDDGGNTTPIDHDDFLVVI